MADELDDFLNKFDDKLKSKAKTERELRRTKSDFHKSFKGTLSKIIHPAMMKILEKLRQHGHFAKMVREEFPIKYYYEYYTIHPKETNKYALISIVGNYDVLKVFVITEYLNRVTHEKRESIKKIEVQHELSEITTTFMEAHVIKVMNEIYALK